MQVVINGINISVIRKPIKNMHLYVKPPDGHVEVSAPKDLPDESIKMFIRTKIGWIRRQMDKFEQQPRQTKREYVSGETLHIWGRQYYLYVNSGSTSNSFSIDGDRAILNVREGSTIEQRTRYINEWYRRILKAEIEKKMPKWEQITGLHPSTWQVKYMTSRWGSCNVNTGKIWLNLQLAKKSPDCLEYIILHELVHLVVKHHDEQFITLMDKYMPNWREIRRNLNSQILDYMPTSFDEQSN